MDTNTKNRLLAVRAEKKKNQPPFVRMESWRYKRVKSSWRRCKGIDNKTRKKYNNGIVAPDVGYRTPNEVRDLHPCGLEDVLILHKEDLEKLSPEVHGIRISARLGAKKKVDLIEFARGKGFRILNIGLSKKELTDIEKAEEEPEEESSSSKKAQIEKIKSKGKSEEAPKEKVDEVASKEKPVEEAKSESKADLSVETPSDKKKKTSSKKTTEK